MKKIGVWGDSITYGSSDKDRGGWVSRLQNRTSGSAKIINLGIRGEKVGDVLSRFQREYAELGRPDIVILAIGINDSPHGRYKGTDITEFSKRYEKLINLAKERAEKVIIIGLTNISDAHPYNNGYLNAKIAKYDEAIKKLAKKHRLTFIDLQGVINDYDLQGDGLHPEANGHQKIYEKVSKGLGL